MNGLALMLLLAQDVAVHPQILEIFKPLPKSFDLEAGPAVEARVTLGRMLFFDARLSKNHDRSCNSCHDLNNFGVDGQKLSTGHKGQLGLRNAPTVYNAAPHIAHFWDGRAANLEAQAQSPILNPAEMAMTQERVLRTVSSIQPYVDLIKKSFPRDKKPLTTANVANAIGAFERRLVTPGRFDRFLMGEADALTAQQKRGLVKFFEYGCTTCHHGAAVGGSSFQRLGLVRPFPRQVDLGRFGVTHNDADRMVFRVPSLRNIARTGPYLHDGSVTDLREVVHLMGRHQLGKEIPDGDVDFIIAFLKALTGEIPAATVARPDLPPSTPRTPKPDPS
jgi:cytochrome c peroxidase